MYEFVTNVYTFVTSTWMYQRHCNQYAWLECSYHVRASGICVHFVTPFFKGLESAMHLSSLDSIAITLDSLRKIFSGIRDYIYKSLQRFDCQSTVGETFEVKTSPKNLWTSMTVTICDQACGNQPWKCKLHRVVLSLISSDLSAVFRFCKLQKNGEKDFVVLV